MNARKAQPDPATGSVPRLKAGLEGMMAALDAGSPYLPEAEVSAARGTLTRAAERLAISGGHTVVALAGATGSGKSTMFNAFVGDLVSEVGRLRPTTTTTTAAVWGTEDAGPLLDWLQIRQRHAVPAGQTGRAGDVDLDDLVLLDLPDFDSYKAEHRAEVDRVLALADVFIWVTDPQKYADALIHDYLRRASDHATVSLVLLNQADRLTPEEQESCRADLRRLLTADGLADTEVLLTSSLTGQGFAELGTALAAAVTAKTATRERLIGDLHRQARTLRAHVADAEPDMPAETPDRVVQALSRSAGVPIVLDAVERDWRRRADAATGWPPVRWVQKAKADPLKRLRLEASKHPKEAVAPPDGFGELLARSSLPTATATSRASVDLATRELGDKAVAGLPRTWATAVTDATHPADDDLADALDQAVVGVDLQGRRPLWWGVWGLLQWVGVLSLVIGLGWLGVIAGISYLQLPQPDVPRVGAVPLPTVMVGAGALLGVLLTLLSKAMARSGARRRRRDVEARLHEAIAGVAEARIVEPVRGVLVAHRTTREGLDKVLAS